VQEILGKDEATLLGAENAGRISCLHKYIWRQEIPRQILFSSRFFVMKFFAEIHVCPSFLGVVLQPVSPLNLF